MNRSTSPTSPRALLLPTLTLAAAACLLSPAAHAQLGSNVEKKDTSQMQPPSPNLKVEEGGDVVPILWSVLIVSVALVANIIPTKRGHQD
jgi:hypothetical protein